MRHEGTRGSGPPRRRTDTRKRIVHPALGLVRLDWQILTSENQMENLVVFTAGAGTEDAARLALLSVIGTQDFQTDPVGR